MSAPRQRFSGWRIVGLGSVCYGFGISPAYYSWGFFLPEMQQDLGLNDTQGGLIFSVFSWIYQLLGPVVGFVMARWGIRSVMGFGGAVGLIAFWLTSRADSFADALFAFGVLGGIAIGFGTILPAQTLASNWFIRSRSRAMAVVLGGGAVVGFGVNNHFAPGILRVADWRAGWLVIAGISAAVGLIAVLFIRGAPEKLDQRPDGDQAADDPEARASTPQEPQAEWTAALALRTRQFWLLVALAIAYSVPWQVITVYGRTHLETLGFATAMAGSILGVRVLLSLFGRFGAFVGDFMPPQRLLAVVFLAEGAGCAGLIAATTPFLAYASVVLIGLGFGAAYVCVPVVFSSFYGRRAFGATVGIRFAITGAIGPSAPMLAGMLSDWSGSHTLTLSILAAICFVAAVVAFGLRAPRLALRATPRETGSPARVPAVSVPAPPGTTGRRP